MTKKNKLSASPTSTSIPADNNQNYSDETSITPIKGTPFGELHHDHKFALIMGNSRLSQWFGTQAELSEFYEENMVNIIITASLIAYEKKDEINKIEEELKPQETESNKN